MTEHLHCFSPILTENKCLEKDCTFEIKDIHDLVLRKNAELDMQHQAHGENYSDTCLTCTFHRNFMERK